MGTFLLVSYIFILVALLLLIFIKGTKGKNQHILDVMEKKQQDLLVLQLEVKDMLLLLESTMEESKEEIDSERQKIEFLIEKFESMLEDQPLPKMEPIKERKKAPTRARTEPGKAAESAEQQEPAKKPARKKQYDLVAKLQSEGKNLDEIAQELNLSKGEAKFYMNISSEKNT